MTKTLIPAQRHKRIQEFLEVHHIAPITLLSEMLQVSEATIRRDLEWLENQGLLERTHGGATLNQRLPLEPEYTYSAQAHPDEKRRIGARAAALVEDAKLARAAERRGADEVEGVVASAGDRVDPRDVDHVPCRVADPVDALNDVAPRADAGRGARDEPRRRTSLRRLKQPADRGDTPQAQAVRNRNFP